MFKRRRLFALVVAFLAAMGIALAGTPAQAATTTEIWILNTTSCLDNATENAGKLQMWHCTGGPEQQWIQEYNGTKGTWMFMNERTKWCITAPSAGAGSVVMSPCDTSLDTQQWGTALTNTPAGQPFAVFFLISNYTSHLCLWTDSGSNGTVPAMAGCGPGSYNERWMLDS
ncbi:Ricin-type beta-trefoil lectin domain-containing protein [Streptomyces sp. 3213]|uniref:RICIN domain-containing protein n=1 Tax=Streptomyces sp. 3213.3 TaxID=1855348 RepID=UPI000898FE14|nr:ricin-type beta-trefoil lectin domain protein [Streptomyces sp. 3213.3]SEE35315.1 Ricin-type beta-trefoil lectin domain-containing protein [Streptomyces sp. 3213] [Streptomyces sp. 3213.3]